MRLDFNILWVEDQQNSVQSQKERLEHIVKQEGFRLRVLFANSVDSALVNLAEDVYTDHIDLILMDYDLGPGKKGDQGLVEVRQKVPYRDIIFYSSQANDLLEMVLKAQVQGVYCSTREELPATAQGVFNTLVKKIIDIDHSRGIVMGTTSDIDHYVMDCLIASFNVIKDEGKEAVFDIVKTRMIEIRSHFDKQAKEIEEIAHVSDLFDHHQIYTSYDRLQLLRKLLKIIEKHADKDDSLNNYGNKTMSKRNLLAHVRVKVDGFERKLVDRRGNEQTSENMKQLRLELLEHHEIFESICADLMQVAV